MLAHSVRFCNLLYILLLDTRWCLRFRSQYFIISKQVLIQQTNIIVLPLSLLHYLELFYSFIHCPKDFLWSSFYTVSVKNCVCIHKKQFNCFSELWTKCTFLAWINNIWFAFNAPSTKTYSSKPYWKNQRRPVWFDMFYVGLFWFVCLLLVTLVFSRNLGLKVKEKDLFG